MVQAIAAVQRSHGLSFFYCTPTILSPVMKYGPPSRQYRPSTPTYQIRRRHTSSSRKGNDIPFEGIQEYDLEDTEQPDTTLTREEKLAFENLRQQEEAEDYEGDEQNEEVLANAYDDLYSLFDSAIRQSGGMSKGTLDKIEENVLRYEGKQYPKAPVLLDSLPVSTTRDMARLKVKDGVIVREHGQDQDTGQELKACRDHLQKTKSRLEAAKTDVEIWNILDQELFSIVRSFNARLQEEQSLLSKKSKQKVNKSRPKESQEHAPMYSQEAGSDPDPSTKRDVTAMDHSHASLTTNEMLAIIQDNYAQLNLMALRLWRQRFAMTPYSLQILPHIKSLGNLSYVLGASTGMYNEILFVKWTQYHDLHGLADLILEMINQGLGANQLTFQLLSSIDRTRKKDLAGQRGKVLRSWWILRGVKEAWVRLRSILQQLEREMGQGRAISYSHLQGALNVQDYGEVSAEDRIPGT